MKKTVNEELENFIQDWHWDKASHKYASDIGLFLLQFMDHLEKSGLSERTIRKHVDNCWCIGHLECSYGYNKKFSPSIFNGNEPDFLYEFKRKMSNSKYAVDSYSATWRKLVKYVESKETNS